MLLICLVVLFLTCVRFLQCWTLISRQKGNMGESAISRNVPKVLIFGLLARKVTITEIS